MKFKLCGSTPYSVEFTQEESDPSESGVGKDNTPPLPEEREEVEVEGEEVPDALEVGSLLQYSRSGFQSGESEEPRPTQDKSS